MPQTIYCYHCRTHHPVEQMRQVETRGGKRWRCIKSIEAVKHKTVEERAAFGLQTSAINKADQHAAASRQDHPDRFRD